MSDLATQVKNSYNDSMANLPNPVDFAAMCKSIRKYRKLKQREMAEKLGVILEAYQKYESGDREPSGQQAYILAQMEADMLEDIEKQTK